MVILANSDYKQHKYYKKNKNQIDKSISEFKKIENQTESIYLFFDHKIDDFSLFTEKKILKNQIIGIFIGIITEEKSDL